MDDLLLRIEVEIEDSLASISSQAPKAMEV
jgi:hypothetical protein